MIHSTNSLPSQAQQLGWGDKWDVPFHFSSSVDVPLNVTAGFMNSHLFPLYFFQRDWTSVFKLWFFLIIIKH